MFNKIKNRDSNFELLRIISMLMIILHHFFWFSNYNFVLPYKVNDLVLIIFQSGGKIGVVLFVMITGYYMVNEKKIKIKKLFELEFQVLYYSIVLFLIFVVFFNHSFIFGDFLKVIFPNIFKLYCFFSSYFILYLLIPYINKFISNISKNEYKNLLVICFVFLILIPSIIIINRTITDIVYLFFYYLLGGYIRLYFNDNKLKYKYLVIFLISYSLIVVITFILSYLSFSYNGIFNYLYSYTYMSSIFVFICGISLFLFFKNIHLGKNKIINYLSSFSFGVYLFHDHFYMRKVLWNNIFSLSKFLNSNFLFFKGICIAIIVYIAGCVFEFYRNLLFFLVYKLFYWYRYTIKQIKSK